MADLADIGKQYNLLLDKYSPKDKATSKPTRVPKKDSDMNYFIETAFFAYDEYQSGTIKDNDLVIQTLLTGLKAATIEIDKYYESSLIIENRERSNADLNYCSGTMKGIDKGIKIQRKKHGSNTSPFKEHEKLIIKLFDEYQASLSSLDIKQKLSDVKVIIQKETGLGIEQKQFDYWRSNYRKNKGKTIFKNTNK